MTTPSNNIQILHKALLFGLFCLLVYFSYNVLQYFIIPMVWAVIIAYMTASPYQWLKQKMTDRHQNLAPFIMTLLMVIAISVPLFFAIFRLQQEAHFLFLNLQKQIFSGHLSVPSVVQKFPLINNALLQITQSINHDPSAFTQTISNWIQAHLSYGRAVLSEISQIMAQLFLTLFCLFFFYRDGTSLLEQLQLALNKIMGQQRSRHYLKTISETTRAVVYGIGLTAFSQAILAGLSYFIADVPNPLLLTLITFALALIPFGTPLAYGAVALWLASQGHIYPAVGVFAWGVCVVSTSDNIIRPLVISGATKIPFLFIMFGVLGGLASFGFIGLFIGPVILAILLAIWREWLHP